MKLIIDTSTLISLARISYLELIPMLKMDIILPDEVYKEAVVEGKEKGFADAVVIQNFIDCYNLNVVEIKSNFIKNLRKETRKISARGDEAVIALAIKENADGIITNDDGLGKIAMSLGFQVMATPDLLVKALKEKLLDGCKFEILMRELVIENRISYKVAELYMVEVKSYVKE